MHHTDTSSHELEFKSQCHNNVFSTSPRRHIYGVAVTSKRRLYDVVYLLGKFHIYLIGDRDQNSLNGIFYII